MLRSKQFLNIRVGSAECQETGGRDKGRRYRAGVYSGAGGEGWRLRLRGGASLGVALAGDGASLGMALRWRQFLFTIHHLLFTIRDSPFTIHHSQATPHGV